VTRAYLEIKPKWRRVDLDMENEKNPGPHFIRATGYS